MREPPQLSNRFRVETMCIVWIPMRCEKLQRISAHRPSAQSYGHFIGILAYGMVYIANRITVFQPEILPTDRSICE
jgi:hypothetical protein